MKIKLPLISKWDIIKGVHTLDSIDDEISPQQFRENETAALEENYKNNFLPVSNPFYKLWPKAWGWITEKAKSFFGEGSTVIEYLFFWCTLGIIFTALFCLIVPMCGIIISLQELGFWSIPLGIILGILTGVISFFLVILIMPFVFAGVGIVLAPFSYPIYQYSIRIIPISFKLGKIVHAENLKITYEKKKARISKRFCDYSNGFRGLAIMESEKYRNSALVDEISNLIISYFFEEKESAAEGSEKLRMTIEVYKHCVRYHMPNVRVGEYDFAAHKCPIPATPLMHTALAYVIFEKVEEKLNGYFPKMIPSFSGLFDMSGVGDDYMVSSAAIIPVAQEHSDIDE